MKEMTDFDRKMANILFLRILDMIEGQNMFLYRPVLV